MAVSLEVMMPVFSLWSYHHYCHQHLPTVSVQFSSFTQSCPTETWVHETPWTAAHQAPLSISNSRSLLKLMSIESVMPSNHLSLCCPLVLLPSIFPASGSFLMSQFFASGGQSIGVLASVLPMNIQDGFPLGWTGWISLQSKGLSRVFSSTTVQKHQLNYCLSTFNEGPYPTMQCSSFCCHIALIISKLWCWKNKKLQICNTRSSSVCIFLYF